MNLSELKIARGSDFNLTEKNADYKAGKNRVKMEEKTAANIKKMFELQSRLAAEGKYAVLVIFQAMDTAGKDGMIKHVMSGLNPQGTKVRSFKSPSAEELSHDYLWRISRHLPERGQIGIFNRSYYEEVLVVKVHNLIENENIPQNLVKDDIWDKRYQQINDYEKYLFENGIVTVKIFLHISKEEQKKRLLARIDDKAKNWKFSSADINERSYWKRYQECYQKMIRETSTKYAPWYVIPANQKKCARYMVSEILVKTLEEIGPEYPELSKEQLNQLGKYKEMLLREK
jgi:PPK2 family polyphosphate:nucleotide phosphotransferase